MYSRLRLYFSSRMRSVCVSLLFCVPNLRFHFRSCTRSLWVWVSCVVYLRSHIRSICVPFRCFPIVFHFSVLFLYSLHSVHYQSVQIHVIAVRVFFLFFYHFWNSPFQGSFNFSFLAKFDSISVALKLHLKKKTSFEDISKCYQSHSN